MTARRLPTLARVESALGEPASQWVARCYEIASAIVDHGLVPHGSAAVYGHWLGPVAPGSYFDHGNGLPFVQHGWVLLPPSLRAPDGRVLDPTRWVFEGRDPYLYVGPADHYDEGGNEWREANLGDPPAYCAPGSGETARALRLSPAARKFVSGLLPQVQPLSGYALLSIAQLFWLANRDPRKLGPHALPIFRAVIEVGEIALIPIDNLRRVEREHAVSLSERTE